MFALIVLCHLIQCVPVGSKCVIESITKKCKHRLEERSGDVRRGEVKKTGIKIDFSIMLAVSRGRHMF